MLKELFKIISAFLVLIVFLFTTASAAEWQLNNEASRLNFVSVKADHVAEAHTFGQLMGHVNEDGNVSFSISLDSVSTGVDIRNERMRKMLFDTSKFTSANIEAKVEMEEINGLAAGQSLITQVESTLDLIGKKSQVNAELKVLKLDDDTIVVSTNKPILLNGDNLGLLDGIEKLREIAGLPSISLAVPVDFSLTFDSK